MTVVLLDDKLMEKYKDRLGIRFDFVFDVFSDRFDW